MSVIFEQTAKRCVHVNRRFEASANCVKKTKRTLRKSKKHYSSCKELLCMVPTWMANRCRLPFSFGGGVVKWGIVLLQCFCVAGGGVPRGLRICRYEAYRGGRGLGRDPAVKSICSLCAIDCTQYSRMDFCLHRHADWIGTVYRTN
jgi:hypothetical protein